MDAQVNMALEPHVAINPSPDVAAAHKLFVFLPGTSGTPEMYRLILRSGARRGFHTLGLNYPNPTAVGELCLGSSDPNCFFKVRSEIISGAPLSDLVSVNVPNSIVTRLTETVAYLNQHFSDEGWGQYLLSNGQIDWSKVVMSGHSQGGGHAGLMAKMFSMSRVVYFASPADWDGSGPAAWVSLPNVTPAVRQYGFTHLDDDLVPIAKLSLIWPTLGLGAMTTAVNVDNTSPSQFGNSHIFVTNATPRLGGISPTHGSTVLDMSTPLAGNGTPVFDPVWAALCFE
ncbi:BPSS1187 family protein [Ideonella sp. BN130291]|uniref:BPSS1187 family protein n=1 Tax=Ideonella sp. BN130291 TaxID=3112940 RepID=UPI002E268FB2|nr:hypothetical protein [Ideonella sp. BN130291]